MSADLEEQIAQLENSLGQEQQRLEKLWDAYEQQEKDFNASLDRINYLESDIETRQTMITSLQELLTERDAKLRDIEIQRQRQSKIAAEYEPKIKEMQGIIEDQTEKYERLLSITQEMEDELDLARINVAKHLGYSEHRLKEMWEWRPGDGPLWKANLETREIDFREEMAKGLPRGEIRSFCEKL